MPPAQVAPSASTNEEPTKEARSSPATASTPRLVDLGADKCVPCKMMVPILDELRKEHKGNLKVEFIDVWKNQDAAEEYQVKSIPTQVFFDKDGKEFYRHEGFMPKADIINVFEKHNIHLAEE